MRLKNRFCHFLSVPLTSCPSICMIVDEYVCISSWKGRKHCGKRRTRKCWISASSPFLTVFLIVLSPSMVNYQDYVIKSYRPLQNPISVCQMALDGLSLTEISDQAAESAEQDQTARMCRLILFYTIRKHSQLSRTWKNRYRPILPGLFYIE